MTRDNDDRTLKPETNSSEFVTYAIAANDRASETVVRAVAIENGCDPLELPPLYETVDPDALNELFDSGTVPDSDVRLSFSYAGYDVRIVGDTVWLRER